MRFGYAFWGFLGDYKFDSSGNELSTPDGNAAYSWSILREAQTRGWDTHLLHPDRDFPGFMKVKDELFSSFCSLERRIAYTSSWKNASPSWNNFPELDVLLLEWRWPIPGRNTFGDRGKPGYQPDLLNQLRILNRYCGTKTKVIFWDLDHKLEHEDEDFYCPDAVFETSVRPRHLFVKRTRVEPPFFIDQLLQHDTLPVNPFRKMVYVGSRYERDDVIEEYLAPIVAKIPQCVELWGNWTNEPNLSECVKKWPHFSYNGRITMRDFRRVYGNAACVPLLAKRSYLETGFITPRPWEALLFGSIPVGISQMTGIDDYVLFKAGSADEFLEVSEELSSMDRDARHELRRINAEKLEFMDARHFVDSIEDVVDGVNKRAA